MCKHFDQLLIVLGMCRRCREILCSFSEEEKLPKLSEEKPSPVATADDDDNDYTVIIITKMKELTMVRGIVINHSPL